MVLMEGESLRQRIAGEAPAGCRVTVTGVLPDPRCPPREVTLMPDSASEFRPA
jgi:hypothetical protein